MTKHETIKVPNSYFEQLITVVPAGPNRGQIQLSPAFQALMQKPVFPEEFKPRYWLGRAVDKVIQELNRYMEEKRKLVLQHTKKYDKDGKLTDKDGKVVKQWKKGDAIFKENGTPDWIDEAQYMKEFTELQEIEVDLGTWPIAFDPEKGPDVNQQEMQIILPLLKEPEANGKLLPFKKKQK